MDEWNFMSPKSRDNLLGTVRREAAGFFDLVSQPDLWEAPTAAGHWEVRDHVGHMVDTTEGYFRAFDAVRGNTTVPDALGVRHMNVMVDEGARSFRDVPQAELVERLKTDFAKMQEIFAGLTDEEWTGLTPPHKYMGPLPAGFYASFQLVDYAVHSWDIREGMGRCHGLGADAADLLVPLAYIVWSATAEVPAEIEPFDVGVRVTGRNGGDQIGHVSGEGLRFEAGDAGATPVGVEFDAASFVLTSYGRYNAGTWRGDPELADKFQNLFFRI